MSRSCSRLWHNSYFGVNNFAARSRLLALHILRLIKVGRQISMYCILNQWQYCVKTIEYVAIFILPKFDAHDNYKQKCHGSFQTNYISLRCDHHPTTAAANSEAVNPLNQLLRLHLRKSRAYLFLYEQHFSYPSSK